MFGVSKFLRTQFSTTIDMMVTQHKSDSEVIGAPGFFVTTEKPDEKMRRLYLDKEIRGETAYYLYQEV